MAQTKQLVLSLFTGVGLLDKAFREMGFIVVSAGDLITGQDIREFHSLPNKFDGLIGGPPCQDYSGLNRNPSNYSDEMLQEFKRIVLETKPKWWLMENVANVPNLKIKGYSWQRFDINQGWYDNVICALQGLNSSFNLPSFNVAGKKRAVGNGVPLLMGRVLAKEVLRVTATVESVTEQGKKMFLQLWANSYR